MHNLNQESEYVKLNNNHIPQKLLGHQTPIQVTKEWYKKTRTL